MFWLIYAIASCLSFGLQDTIQYYLTTAGEYQFSTAALNTVVHGFIVVILLVGLIIGYFIKPKGSLDVVKSLKILFSKPGVGIFAFFAGLSAMVANILYFYSQQTAPNINPGVMTAISNGAIIFAILLPFIFYGKKINLKQIVGIVIIFISFIMLGNDKFKGFDSLFGGGKTKESFEDKDSGDKKQTGSLWLFLALGSALCYGIYSFFQYVTLRKSKNLNTTALTLFVAFVETVIGIIIYFMFKNKSLSGYQTDSFKNYNKDMEKLNDSKYLPYTLSSALFNALGIITLLLGYIGAPNPGFSDAVSDAYLVPLGILSYVFYNVKMNSLQLMGCLVAIIGTTVLST